MKRLLNVLKQIRIKDLLAPFIFLLMLIPSLIFRLVNKIHHRKLWLISEDGEARDNGYHFYKYIRHNYPKDFCYYAINKDSVSYKKVFSLGSVINYGSLKHWLYYMSANLNISSQKSGNPCPIFWYFIHVGLGLYKNRVFLQHGVTHNDAKWLYYDKTKFKYFVCATKQEYDFVFKKFGYKVESLLLTGFPRWDALKDTSKFEKQKSILIMPTWRKWINEEIKFNDFRKTEYFKRWENLLSDKDFVNYVNVNNIIVYFYPHINMKEFLDDFKLDNENVKVVSPSDDIQKYLNKCSLMITDYSSVAFDFAYLGKSVIYYQFDEKDFREKQHAEGYFRFKKDGFGPVVTTKSAILKYVPKAMREKLGAKNIDKYFSGCSANGNSERLYNYLHTVELEK